MRFLLTIITGLLLLSCQGDKKKLILVSKDPSNSYTSWLLSLDSNLMIREFYNIVPDSMEFYLLKCDGIVMTGGEDVNPKLYGKPGYKDLCEAPDNFRDSIEEVMIRYAMDSRTSMIGICRGQQIINAVTGGTLIPDIPTENPESIITHRSKSDSAHTLYPMENSWISLSTNQNIFWVNSRHHQAVDEVAPGFKVSAYSPDSIIESIEYKYLGQQFIIGVQWHPENLRDSLANILGNKFLERAL